jgi:hypothetical protein
MEKATISPSRSATQPFESARKDAATLSVVMPRSRSCSIISRFSRTDVRTREMSGRSAAMASRKAMSFFGMSNPMSCHQRLFQLPSRHLLPGSSAKQAPERAVGRMPGTSPGMTSACRDRNANDAGG